MCLSIRKLLKFACPKLIAVQVHFIFCCILLGFVGRGGLLLDYQERLFLTRKGVGVYYYRVSVI